MTPSESNATAAALTTETDGRTAPLPNLTPAMRQWADQKAQVADALLLFRMGDFYETFYDDAHILSRVLGITLTQRDKGVPLAGIPYHALDGYLAKLVRAGLKVAISEQTEDARQAKGLVKREIVRVVTPGTLTDDQLLPGEASNYLVALFESPPLLIAAAVDLSTGDYFTLSGTSAMVQAELVRRSPSEILYSESCGAAVQSLVEQLREAGGSLLVRRPPHDFDLFHAQRLLHRQFDVATLEGFGYLAEDPELSTAGALLAYLRETQRSQIQHLVRLYKRRVDDYVHIDPHSWRSLEIERTLRSGSSEGTLYVALNRTCGPMGARRLREALRFPLRRPEAIQARQEAVAEWLAEPPLLKTTREHLKNITDLERITARLGVGRCTPRDLLGLGQSLQHISRLGQFLIAAHSTTLLEYAQALQGWDDLTQYLQQAIHPQAPLQLNEGGIIATGFNPELDRLRSIGVEGRQWLANYQAEQARRTGIHSLKVGFNKVFGYYIEITHTHHHLVPPDYVRKQTVKNAERYITEALKNYENEVLTAQERANDLEFQLFEQIKQQAGTHIPRLLLTAQAIGMLDLLAGWACLAAERGYVRPEISTTPELHIVAGRHPAIEQNINQPFVPNDTTMHPDEARLLLITGPNMAGKSTYIRQVALLTLQAQTGCFVPAQSMRWGLIDQLFARVGASDELTRGQSTFMVEMIEAANILNNATSRSLVVLDELGRGTSTYDGLSLAWAICEALLTRNRCRALFATHYHELTELAHLLPGVQNYNVAVREWPGTNNQPPRIVFLHQIVPGGTDQSYGVHVAQLAGVPGSVTRRARQILHILESGLSRSTLRETLSGRVQPPTQQLELFTVQEDRLRQALLELDLDTLTPIQALQKLKELQDEAK